MWTTVILALTCLMATTQAFIVLSFGKCPNIPVKSGFELDKYLGKWYSYENFDAPFQIGLSCIAAEYSIKDNGKIRVLNTGSRRIKIFGWIVNSTPIDIEGEAFIVDNDEPAGLNVRFGGQPDFDSGGANYLIVDTDYENYSLVYSCSQPANFPLKIEFAWILTRQRGVPPANIEALKANLRSYGVKTSNFKRVDDKKCD